MEGDTQGAHLTSKQLIEVAKHSSKADVPTILGAEVDNRLPMMNPYIIKEKDASWTRKW